MLILPSKIYISVFHNISSENLKHWKTWNLRLLAGSVPTEHSLAGSLVSAERQNVERLDYIGELQNIVRLGSLPWAFSPCTGVGHLIGSSVIGATWPSRHWLAFRTSRRFWNHLFVTSFPAGSLIRPWKPGHVTSTFPCSPAFQFLLRQRRWSISLQDTGSSR